MAFFIACSILVIINFCIDWEDVYRKWRLHRFEKHYRRFRDALKDAARNNWSL